MWKDTSALALEEYPAETMDALHSELHRLGCGHRNCGIQGLIFAPRNTGGFNVERGRLHYWDTGVNVYLDWDRACQCLAALPNNAGQEKMCGALLEMEDK